MGGAILVGLLVHHVTRHKHGDEVAGGEPALIGLKGRKGDQKCQSDFKNTYLYIFCCTICICVPQTMEKYDHKMVFCVCVGKIKAEQNIVDNSYTATFFFFRSNHRGLFLWFLFKMFLSKQAILKWNSNNHNIWEVFKRRRLGGILIKLK